MTSQSSEAVATFPLLHARTQRFTLGRPRSFRVSPDGTRVWFVRSDAGDDPVHHLHLVEVPDGTTRRVVDARGLEADEANLTPAERARRERAREGGSGIVGFATDRMARLVAFVLGGRAFVADEAGTVLEVDSTGGAHDPRPSPDGTRLALVVGGEVHGGTVPLDAHGRLDPDGKVVVARLVGPTSDEAHVTWGLAEFAAAEEMGRDRGLWWDPAGDRLLVARVDESAVATAWLVDPIDPTVAPRAHRYPFAGTANAEVDLHLVQVAPAPRTASGLRVTDVAPVGGDRDHYLLDVSWSDPDLPALVTWQDRRQHTTTITALFDGRCVTQMVRRGDPWTEPVPGTPTWFGTELVIVEPVADHDVHGLVSDGAVVSPPDLDVRSVVGVVDDEVLVTALDGVSRVLAAIDPAMRSARRVVEGPGIVSATVGGPTRVETHASLDGPTFTRIVTALDHDGRRGDGELHLAVAHHALEWPSERPAPHLTVRSDGVRVGVVMPDGDGPFPVLLDPYGGPHGQRVVAARSAWLVAQWFAQHGIAVVVVDNRGTPGRPSFEAAVAGDLATAALEDQFDVLDDLAAGDPRLDLSRVAIRGWSFGGYLAALAALRRPDRLRAAVVGAPPVDWRLYDTHYTERYLGLPDEHPEAYRVSSLVDDDGQLVAASDTNAPVPMLLVHGMVDDNVLAANSLVLSRALLEAGWPHEFLPLSGVTHMTPQERVAANLLTHQLDFLQRHLG